MKIQFNDFERENRLFEEKILFNISLALRLKSEYEHEEYIRKFEIDFADFNQSKFVIAVNSGTTALELALQCCGIKKDDEVILSSYTYISTALAVSNLGARPIFVDIKDDTLTIDPEKIRKSITKKTRAIIAVHVHGNPCDMAEIKKILQNEDLALIEDASHAHGAQYKGIKVGNFGIGCFSCYINKILGVPGNAGLITTNDENMYKAIMEMIDVKDDPSLNLCKRTPCRIGLLEAAFLKAKLPYLAKIIEKRRDVAKEYIQNMPESLSFQKAEKNSFHVYRDFVIRSKDRKRFIEYLKIHHIETKIRYGMPLHLTKYYENFGCAKRGLPVTEDIAQNSICFPLSFTYTKKQLDYLCRIINGYK